eukprot:4768349-Amphidinium_carterae.1
MEVQVNHPDPLHSSRSPLNVNTQIPRGEADLNPHTVPGFAAFQAFQAARVGVSYNDSFGLVQRHTGSFHYTFDGLKGFEVRMHTLCERPHACEYLQHTSVDLMLQTKTVSDGEFSGYAKREYPGKTMFCIRLRRRRVGLLPGNANPLAGTLA